MSPRQVVEAWVDAFNRADADALAAMYSEDAINHQVANAPVIGREAIRAMFASDFAEAILEWRDPKGLRGYWDKLCFLRLHGLDV